MRLTQRTDLALRALIFLSARWPATGTVIEMAQALGVSSNHLMKSVQDLRHGGFVESTRGYAGGHRLVRAPKQIRVVSSDRRLQIAARRRKGNFVTSEQFVKERENHPLPLSSDDSHEFENKPTTDLTEAEIAEWLKLFGETEDTSSA